MTYEHSNVYIVRVVDTNREGTDTWFVGPYGSTRADQVAAELESVARGAADGNEPDASIERQCYVEALFSDEDCLVVTDYGRDTQRSLH